MDHVKLTYRVLRGVPCCFALLSYDSSADLYMAPGGEDYKELVPPLGIIEHVFLSVISFVRSIYLFVIAYSQERGKQFPFLPPCVGLSGNKTNNK